MMDKRDFILELLENYKSTDKNEEKSRIQMIQFIEYNPNCFENDYKQGHITGSALVVDRDIEYTLLTHHLLLHKWFQFGGHSDGHWNPLEVAWREAQEESGLISLEYIPGHDGIFGLDVHLIPKRDHMPAHNHYDVRILLTADKNEPYKVSHESNDLKWVKIDEVKEYNSQPAFLRLIDKVLGLKSII